MGKTKDNRVLVQARIPKNIHTRMRILAGKNRPYASLSDLISFAVEKEVSSYDDEDMEYYRQMALAAFDLMGDDDEDG